MFEPVLIVVFTVMLIIYFNSRKVRDKAYEYIITFSAVLVSITIVTVFFSLTMQEDGSIKNVVLLIMIAACNLFVYFWEKCICKKSINRKYKSIMHGYILGLSVIFYIYNFKYVANSLFFIMVAFYFNFYNGAELQENKSDIVSNLFTIILSAAITVGAFLGNKSVEMFFYRMIPSLIASCVIAVFAQIHAKKKNYDKIHYE